jgi:hypothetical protein
MDTPSFSNNWQLKTVNDLPYCQNFAAESLLTTADFSLTAADPPSAVANKTQRCNRSVQKMFLSLPFACFAPLR